MTRLQSAQYPVIPAEAILEVGDTLRAPRSAYARGDWEFEWADYTCKENGWEEPWTTPKRRCSAITSMRKWWPCSVPS